MNRRRSTIRTFVLLFLVLALALSACTPPAPVQEETEPVTLPEAKPQMVGDWEATTEWTLTQDGKDYSLTVTAGGESAAWNTAYDLSETTWSISAEYDFQKAYATMSYGRMLFGDAYGNVCLAVTIKYDTANAKFLTTADTYNVKGWKNVHTGTWTDADPAQSLKLKVNYAIGNDKADIVVSQGKTDLLKTKTDRMSERVYNMFARFGLGVWGGTTVISDITPRVIKKEEPTSSDTQELATDSISNIDSKETDEWVITENAVYGEPDGKPTVIIDGYGENKVWNCMYELGDAWCFESDVTFGSTMQGACCSRFILGPSAHPNGKVGSIITVEYSGSRQVEAFIETSAGGGWNRVASTDDWTRCSNNTVTVRLYKLPGISRICLDVMDHGTSLFCLASDEIDADTMLQYMRLGLMVYSSQVRFTNFSFRKNADGCTVPDMTAKEYPVITQFTVGAPKESEIWGANESAVFYDDPELGEALAIDSRGDTYCHYQGFLDGSWHLSARVEYGTYYGNVAANRISLMDDARDMTGLITLYSSPKNGESRLSVQSRTDSVWTDECVVDWFKGDKAYLLDIRCDGDDILHVTVTGLNTKTVLIQEDIPMSNGALGRTTMLGLGTLGAMTRYTQIKMEP